MIDQSDTDDRQSFAAMLRVIPEVGDDADFERHRDMPRQAVWLRGAEDD